MDFALGHGISLAKYLHIQTVYGLCSDLLLLLLFFADFINLLGLNV
jgi:hypothetical protein